MVRALELPSLGCISRSWRYMRDAENDSISIVRYSSGRDLPTNGRGVAMTRSFRDDSHPGKVAPYRCDKDHDTPHASSQRG